MPAMEANGEAGGRLAPETVADVVAYLGRRVEPSLCPPYLAGRCLVCGRPAVFFTDGWQTYREALRCSECNTTSRYRSIALGVLRAVHEIAGVTASSVAELRTATPDRRLAVFDTQTPFSYDLAAYRIPELLGQCSWIDVHVSSYRPSLPWGMTLGAGWTNEDLQALSFRDDSFDVVVTSDVMEHVRLDERAHREIYRVLRPGGAYVFTVPTRVDSPTRELIRVHDPDDASRDDVLEREVHGNANDPDAQAIAYRVYGADLPGMLEEVGFSVDFQVVSALEPAIMHTDNYYCRKPASSGRGIGRLAARLAGSGFRS